MSVRPGIVALALLLFAVIAVVMITHRQETVTTLQSPLTPRAYLPVAMQSWKASDPRYVAWGAPREELSAAGLNQSPTTFFACSPEYDILVTHTDCRDCALMAAAHPGKFYTVSDEPDLWGVSPEVYWNIYRLCRADILAADPTARVAIAGIAQPNPRPGLHGLDYMNALWEASGGTLQTAELRVHAFPPQDGSGLSGWKAYIESWKTWRDEHMPGTPLALGTFGYPSGSASQAVTLARTQEMLAWLEASGLTAWYWWQWDSPYGENYSLWENGALTPVGEVWAQMATD